MSVSCVRAENVKMAPVEAVYNPLCALSGGISYLFIIFMVWLMLS